MPSQDGKGGFFAARDIVSFAAGALTVAATFLGVLRPTMERIADERAVVVESRLRQETNEKFKLLLDEVRMLRAEILALRRAEDGKQDGR